MRLSVSNAAPVIRRVIGAFALAMSGVLCAGQIASGQSDGPDVYGITHPSIASSLPGRGDPAGLRQWLAHHGVAYNLLYVSDVLSNLRGGLRRGTIAQGKLEGSLYIDFEKLAGRTGLSLFANFFQIHNTGRIRRDYVGGINTVSAIEAVPTTRLSELWLEQKFAGNAASLRVGQLTADSEFFVSDMTGMFLQSDWPTIAAANLPSGGAAYPLSTPGVRLKVNPTEDVSLLLGVFNGDPAGPGDGDEQIRNRHGLNFRVRDPAFVIGEAQFRRNQGKSDPGWQPPSGSAAGDTSEGLRIDALPPKAACWPIPPARARRACTGAIAGFTLSSTSRFTGPTAAMLKVVSRFSAVCR